MASGVSCGAVAPGGTGLRARQQRAYCNTFNKRTSGVRKKPVILHHPATAVQEVYSQK
jgi:hypothetical protein